MTASFAGYDREGDRIQVLRRPLVFVGRLTSGSVKQKERLKVVSSEGFGVFGRPSPAI